MARTVKLVMPFLIRKSNVINFDEHETMISFSSFKSRQKVIQIVLFNSDSRHLKHHAVIGSEIEKLKLNIVGFNLFWIEREAGYLRNKVEAIIE